MFELIKSLVWYNIYTSFHKFKKVKEIGVIILVLLSYSFNITSKLFFKNFEDCKCLHYSHNIDWHLMYPIMFYNHEKRKLLRKISISQYIISLYVLLQNVSNWYILFTVSVLKRQLINTNYFCPLHQREWGHPFIRIPLCPLDPSRK